MANILANIIPDPDTGLYSSRVAGINGNEAYISDGVNGEARSWVYQTVLFYLADTDNSISNPDYSQSNFENKLSYWSNVFFIPNTIFNPGVDRRGWVFLADVGWTWLEPQVFEQQQYAPFWLWLDGLSLGTSSKWCYFDRSFIGQHWSFEKQYINPIPTNTSEKIYDTASGIDIVEPGKSEGFGVYLWVNEKQSFRSFIKNSENKIFMSNVAINTTPPTSGGIVYIRVK